MSFYDIDPMTLPAEAIYYHNVLMICVAITPKNWQFDDMDEIWYLDQITSARPTAYIFYPDEDLEEEFDDEGNSIEFEIELISHCVVEVCDNNSVCWYPGDDNDGEFNLKDSWRIKS